jgi:hypothetical protein
MLQSSYGIIDTAVNLSDWWAKACLCITYILLFYAVSTSCSNHIVFSHKSLFNNKIFVSVEDVSFLITFSATSHFGSSVFASLLCSYSTHQPLRDCFHNYCYCWLNTFWSYGDFLLYNFKFYIDMTDSILITLNIYWIICYNPPPPKLSPPCRGGGACATLRPGEQCRR